VREKIFSKIFVLETNQFDHTDVKRIHFQN